MTPVVSTASLTQDAINHQKRLRFLPHFLLGPLLAKWGIALQQIDDRDIAIHFLRKAGLWKPYQTGTIDYNTELGKFLEVELSLEMAYCTVRENINNYIKKAATNGVGLAGTGYLAKKKHPLQGLIVAQMLVSTMEELIVSIWFAKRDTGDKSPMGLFDGFHEKIDQQIAAGTISTSNGNMIGTGPIKDPSTQGEETTAIEQLIAFVDALSGFLKNNASLFLSAETLRKAQNALDNKWVNKDVKVADVLEYVNAKCGSKIRNFHTDEVLGTGDRIMATVPGNMDFGMSTISDKEFVQIRDIYEDPNELQFWVQAKFGTRIIGMHKKLFAVNDQVQKAPVGLLGDY